MTTPLVMTVSPASGEVAPVPWTSAIVASGARRRRRCRRRRRPPGVGGAGGEVGRVVGGVGVRWRCGETEVVLSVRGRGGRCRRSRWPCCRSRRSRRPAAGREQASARRMAAAEGGRRVDQGDLAGACRPSRSTPSTSAGTSVVPPVPGGLTRRRRAAGRQRAGQGGHLPARPGRPRRTAPTSPSRSTARGARVDQLDEVVLVGGAGVAAAAVDLVDHDRGAGDGAACALVAATATIQR